MSLAPEEGHVPEHPGRHRSTYRRAFHLLAPILKPRRMMLGVAALALLANVGFDLLKPWPLKFVVDNLVPGASFLPAWAQAPGFDERVWMLVVICKLGLVERADLILVLDRGLIVESGTSAELQRRGGLYAQLRASAAANDGELSDILPVRSIEPRLPDGQKSTAR